MMAPPYLVFEVVGTPGQMTFLKTILSAESVLQADQYGDQDTADWFQRQHDKLDAALKRIQNAEAMHSDKTHEFQSYRVAGEGVHRTTARRCIHCEKTALELAGNWSPCEGKARP